MAICQIDLDKSLHIRISYILNQNNIFLFIMKLCNNSHISIQNIIKKVIKNEKSSPSNHN